MGEVETARQEIRTALEKIPLAVMAWRPRDEPSLARFQAGTAIILEVLDAHSSVARAQLKLARAISAFNLSQVRLLAAAGRIYRDSVLPEYALTRISGETQAWTVGRTRQKNGVTREDHPVSFLTVVCSPKCASLPRKRKTYPEILFV